ncbi:MAG: response regulator [Pyrinomonadaceae bacterium]
MNDSDKKTILLAEDDDSMRRLLEVILKKNDFEIIAAEDGLQAMKLAFENRIDAVVADAIMPGLTGYDLCRMLKKRADKKDVPVIILSGLGTNESESAKCSADAFLSKTPRLKDELIETLKKLL